MIAEGLELMMVGMGVVFSFLVLLVILMKLSGFLLSKFPEPEEPVKAASKAGQGGAAGSRASATMAVALAAAHRRQKGI
ncbi:MAG: OadG family protein [Akkermansiaceae bacterium]|nr:OadG family protein [Akkermansiaceae bacterium]